MTGRRIVKPMVGLHGSLAEAVTVQLSKQGISQESFAATVGVTPKHLSQLLTGKAGGSLAIWNLMLFTLGIERVDVTWNRA